MRSCFIRPILAVDICASATLAQQTAPHANSNEVKVSAAEQAVWEKEEAYWRGGAHYDIYRVKFTGLFDVPPEECRPREPWIYEGSGRARCRATFNTLEGSRASAYQLIERHHQKSRAQIHYDPHGVGVRFAGEPLTSVYPWAKIVGTFAVFGLAIALARLAQSPQIRRWQPDAVETR